MLSLPPVAVALFQDAGLTSMLLVLRPMLLLHLDLFATLLGEAQLCAARSGCVFCFEQV
jgi:hypothetical protein